MHTQALYLSDDYENGTLGNFGYHGFIPWVLFDHEITIKSKTCSLEKFGVEDRKEISSLSYHAHATEQKLLIFLEKIYFLIRTKSNFLNLQ